MTPNTEGLPKLRQAFQSLDIVSRQEAIKKLTKSEQLLFYRYPDLFLFDKQIITGNQRYTILRCGRRFGKTVAGSAWIAKRIREGHKSLALCGATYGDVFKIMVSAIRSWFSPKENEQIRYNHELNTLNFLDFGAIIYCHSSDKEIRGFSVSHLWCDELGNWSGDGTNPDKVKERFQILDTTVSIGEFPQTLITSTPKPFPLYFEWQAKIDQGNPDYKLILGNMDDNPFLSETYKRIEREKYLAMGQWGRQEYYGSLEDSVPGAAWTHEMVEKCHLSIQDFLAIKNNKASIEEFKLSLTNNKPIPKPFQINRIVVSVDPTVSDKPDNDECGIIIAALGSDGHAYILADRSGHYTTSEWAKEAVQALKDFRAGMIIIEDNNGGELVKKNILSYDPNVPIQGVKATKGKIDRALPVAALYSRGLVHHIMPSDGSNPFEVLERQMTRYTGNPKEKSPDRLDALTWAIYALKLNQVYIPYKTDVIPHF